MPDSMIDSIGTMGWKEGAGSATTLTVRERSIDRMGAPADVPAPHGANYLRPPPDKDPEVLTYGKWAAVVLHDDQAGAADALAPLIAHRRENGHLWNDGIIALNPSAEGSLASWRRRFKRGIGNDKPPYYLLLVGGPDRFPFEMQYDLDLHKAVGRLDASEIPGGDFSWDACRCYAEKVVAYERNEIAIEPKPLFYSLQSDNATRISHKHLVAPLSVTVPGGVDPLYGDDAMVSNLCQALDTDRAPKIVFTASHGFEFPKDPVLWGALTAAKHSGSARDPLVTANVAAGAERFGYGSIVFSFACFSAGVPVRSAVSFLAGDGDKIIEMGARVAALPRQLLGHPKGPVAFIGHVDRVTAVAFQSSFGMARIAPYDDFLSWLRNQGATVGQALGTIRENARVVGTQITAALETASEHKGDKHILKKAGRKWIGFRDYRGFMLLGDPAVTPP